MLLLLRRRLELCRKIYLYRIKKEKPDKNQDFGLWENFVNGSVLPSE